MSPTAGRKHVKDFDFIVLFQINPSLGVGTLEYVNVSFLDKN
jgi:hypothetical protein